MPRINSEVQFLADRYGIVFPGACDFLNSQLGMDSAAALLSDAAPTNLLQAQLITTGNAGIPAYLTNFLDPKLTEVLTTPLRAVEIFGEQKKGDWTTKTAIFPMVESTGEVSSYGDYNMNGLSDVNTNFEPRQSYHYQTFTKWGDLELEQAGLAKIDLAARKNISSALTLNKFMNKTYFFGVTGLDNFGALNDPSLLPSITPSTKTAGGTTWAKGTGLEIWADIQALFKNLSSQTGGLVEATDELTLAMSANVSPFLLTAMQNVYGNSTVQQMLKEAFPRLTIKTAMEYSTSAGEVIQLIAKSVQGQEQGFCAFTEKMRAHAVVRGTSDTYQKKSAGTWGFINKFPAGISSGIGY